jgi:hypothetical protein
MTAMITASLAALGRRIALWGALSLAVVIAVQVMIRHGRRHAEAELAIRRADARIRALRISREVHHDIEALPDAERARRLDRWMRD